MVWKPRLTVAAVIERDKRYLMVEETIAGQTMLNQPAGHVEDGESILAAVVRETREETAWHFQPEALIGIYRWVHADGETFIRATFSGTVSDFNPHQPLDADIDTTRWLTLDELQPPVSPWAFRSPLVMRCILDYQQGRRFPLELLQDVESPGI